MKTGIICDNFKVDKFREELELYDFEYVHVPLTTDTTAIQIWLDESRFEALEKLVIRVERFFKIQKN